jgi:hypothetical protein
VIALALALAGVTAAVALVVTGLVRWVRGSG